MLKAPALETQARDRTAEHLQTVLVRLIDLALQSKQAHWNVVGPNFRAVHLQLDELWEVVQKWGDAVAERMLALDVAARGQAGDVRKESSLEALPPGRLPDADVVELMAERLDTLASEARTAMHGLEPHDLVSQDLLMELIHDLEKQLWMFRSQLQG